MKKRKWLLLCAILMAGLLWFSDPMHAFAIEKGERLQYGVKFLYVLPVGNVSIGTEAAPGHQDNKAFLIKCTAKTASWISLLFKAEAVLNSYVTEDKMLPYKFEQILKIAGKPDDIRRATYDRGQNIMEAEGKGKKKVPADVRDPISAMYYLRAQDLKEGAEIKQVVNSNQSNYIFDSRVTGKKKVGKFNCWIVDAKVRRENKSMYHSMDVVFYISDDVRHLPVLIKANTKVGPVTLTLKGVQ
ncbi:MAG: DUF3108 domain-containing protein [Candidatus Omnitrophica bacterium]|nr:DUF3108 domain-containing protein [Candidatus Omnitrophota bacterium]